MALDTPVDATPAFRTFATALRGRDGELAGPNLSDFYLEET